MGEVTEDETFTETYSFFSIRDGALYCSSPGSDIRFFCKTGTGLSGVYRFQDAGSALLPDGSGCRITERMGLRFSGTKDADKSTYHQTVGGNPGIYVFPSFHVYHQ